ncbi:DUF5133 domain-containing protein [Streptomyces griseoluteus]|uniref:DUF5133 domain-containing protein n=1 Tax=Streptomyces griseoluteus TaxID=29306 RepID=A0A4Z1CWS4_STRGP|nr:DUF5133 domain-containing protein [Streptomyces griseoluteus]TGN73402.1 DUF5133 domain-containing protein [Streptomyces griseoluteus]
MLLPAEKNLRAVMARFAGARIDHDALPTPETSRRLEDSSNTLCVMTGTHTIKDALRAADAMLEQYRADRSGITRAEEALAA